MTTQNVSEVIGWLQDQLIFELKMTKEYEDCHKEITSRDDLTACCIVYDFDDRKIAIYPAYEENDNCLILLRNKDLLDLIAYKEKKEKGHLV